MCCWGGVQVCRADSSQRSRFIRCIYNLLDADSGAVRYDAAATLVTLSSAPTAIEAAARCYIDLIVKEADNNIKLIVLDRLIELKNHPAHERTMQVCAKPLWCMREQNAGFASGSVPQTRGWCVFGCEPPCTVPCA